MVDVDEAAFAREVLEASQATPVLVDFWAPWCAPCRTLGPLLERLEAQYAGRFKLVKVDSDANGALAARYQVRSIPYVIAVSGGAVVDSFVGALPERQLRDFIERVAPRVGGLCGRASRACAIRRRSRAPRSCVIES